MTDAGTVWLEVTLRFRLDGRTADITLPSEWQGQRELYRAVRSLAVMSPGASLQQGEKPWKKTLTFPAGRVVTLRYQVIKDCTGNINASSYFRVMLGADYFQVMGRNFLVYPSLPEDTELPIFLEWKNIPSDWGVISSLSAGAVSRGVPKGSGADELVSRGAFWCLYRFRW